MTHHHSMLQAISVAATARLIAPPNPWVGCVLVCADGQVFTGATEAPGARHAERVALEVEPVVPEAVADEGAAVASQASEVRVLALQLVG